MANLETDFDYLHLPDDGQLFLRPTVDLLRRELSGLSAEPKRLAAAHFQEGDTTFAEWRYEEAIDLYAASGRVAASLSACLAQGVASMMISALQEAVALFEEGKVQAQRQGARRFEAAFRINAGQVYSDLGHGEWSSKELGGARQIIEQLDDPSLESVVLSRLAVACFLRGEYDRGMEYCGSLEGGVQPWPDSLLDRDASFARAVLSLAKGGLRKAEQELQTGIQKVNGRADDHGDARLYMQLAMLYLLRGKNREADKPANRAIDICRQLRYPQGEARGLELQAEIFFAAGQEQRGAEAFTRAIELNCRAGYRRGQARSRLQWAKIYLQRGKFEDAQKLIEEARQVVAGTGHRSLSIEVNAMSVLLSVERSVGEKIAELFELLEMSRSAGLPGAEILLLKNLGSLSMAIGQYDQALEYFQLALARSQQLGNRFEQGKIWELLAHLMEQQQHKELSVEYLGISSSILQDIGLNQS